MKPLGLFCAAAGLAWTASGEFQLPDRLAYGDRTWEIAVYPLEEYGPVRSGDLSLWWAPDTVFPANARGYVASWQIEDDRLWLTGIEGCQGSFLGEYQPASLATLFPDRPAGQDRVWADWFSGRIPVPSQRFGAHLLPLTEEKRLAAARWTLTVSNGVVTEVQTGTPRNAPAATARYVAAPLHYASMPRSFALVARPEVRAELALTEPQIAALAQDASLRAEPQLDLREKPMAQPDAAVSASLTADQDARLRELIVQMNGPPILLSSFVKTPPSLPLNGPQRAELNKAYNQAQSQYADLLAGYFYRHADDPDELDVLADALADVTAACDAAVLAALTPGQREAFAKLAGAPLAIAWPKHENRRPPRKGIDAQAAAEARRGAPCETPAKPPGIEFIGRDALRLTRENLVFRRISPKRHGEAGRDFFMMETEVPNAAYALYLEDTRQQKGDQELRKKLRDREKSGAGIFSTADTPYLLDNPALLWSNNVPPEGRGKFPVALVMHSDAVAFCRWLNARYPGPGDFWLPDRSQWGVAAYGGKSRSYPWGDEWDPAIPCISPSSQPVRTEPVAVDGETRDVTPDGIRHLGGNVQEYLAELAPGETLIAMDSSWAGNSFRSSPEDPCGPQKPRNLYWGYHHGDRSRQEDMGFRVIWMPEEDCAE